MSSPDQFDTRFSLPAIDDSPLTETGVILMGLDAERLLAGLGMATLADDPALVVLAVDQLRHGLEVHASFDALIDAGSRRWLAVRPVLAAAGRGTSTSASLRQAWRQTLQILAAGDLAEVGPATAAHLAACWLRRAEIDRRVADLLALGKESFDDISPVAVP